MRDYTDTFLAHMRIEENEVLPLAQRVLSEDDWRELDAAFATNRDPLTGHVPDDAYRSLDVPFAEIRTPAFAIEVVWTLPRLMDYLSTWSAVKRYQAALGQDPIADLMAELDPLWGNAGSAKTLRWPLFLRVGRQPAIDRHA